MIGDLLGIEIHYFAAINLDGFKEAIDAIGGVDITVDRAIADPVYSEDGFKGPASISTPGRTTWTGRSRWPTSGRAMARATATSHARNGSRRCSPRARKLTAGNLLLSLPGLLDAVRNMIATDVPASRISALARAIQVPTSRAWSAR